MKISDLIQMLRAELDSNGDLEVVYPSRACQYLPVGASEVRPMFIRDGYGSEYSPDPLPRQGKNEHEHVLVLIEAGS